MKNFKYQKFEAGRAGSGRINLADGKLEFTHKDVAAEDLQLAVEVSHVYSKGQWKLNLYQTLKKDNPNDDTKYTYTDASGNKEHFSEKYYYKRLEQRVYKKADGSDIERADVEMDISGNLYFYENGTKYKVFQKIISDSGLSLHTDYKGFKNSEVFESRHEEIVKAEDEIFQLEKTIEDLKYNKAEYEKINSLSYTEIQQLQKDIENNSLALERKNINQYNFLKTSQRNLLSEKNAMREITKKGRVNLGGYSVTDYNLAAAQWESSEYSYHQLQQGMGYIDSDGFLAEHLNINLNHNQVFMIETQDGKLPKKIQKAQQFFQQKFNDKIRTKEQAIENISKTIENQSQTNQEILMTDKEGLLSLQEEYSEKKQALDAADFTKLKARYNYLIDVSETEIKKYTDLKKYKQAYLYKTLYNQIPEIFIVADSGLFYGFNHYGNLCQIADNYENFAAIIYECDLTDTGEADNFRIVKVVDNEEKSIGIEYNAADQIESITDSKGGKTNFIFGSNSKLEKIAFPNGELTEFTYQSNLMDIFADNKLGVRLTLDENERVVRLAEISKLGGVTAFGAVDGQEQIVRELLINYALNCAVVTDKKSKIKTTYLFNANKQLTAEQVTEIDSFEQDKPKSITTYDTESKHCAFVLQQTEFDSLLQNVEVYSNPSIVEAMGNQYRVTNRHSGNDRLVWSYKVNPQTFPKGVTDFVLSGFVSGQSVPIVKRRKTAYCEHLESSIARFELSAALVYASGNIDYCSSFDSGIAGRQFTALPVTLKEDDNGEPILPTEIKIIFDFSGNSLNNCIVEKPLLCQGDWNYVQFDSEQNKTDEWFGEKITDISACGKITGETRKKIYKLTFTTRITAL